MNTLSKMCYETKYGHKISYELPSYCKTKKKKCTCYEHKVFNLSPNDVRACFQLALIFIYEYLKKLNKELRQREGLFSITL